MAACCYFGVDLGNWLDHNSLSRLTDGTPHSSCDLLYFIFLLPFTWTKYFKSSSLSPLRCFGQKIFISNLSSFFFSDKNILSPTSIPQKYPETFPISVLAAKSFQSRKNILNPILFLTWKNSFFLLTYFILLPLEAKHCPWTLASVLACADSVEDFRFWN